MTKSRAYSFKLLSLAIAPAAVIGAVSVLLAPSAALANDISVYGNLGLSHVDADNDVSFEAVTGRLGARFTPNLAIEAEASKGFEQDSLDGVNYELNHDYGIYGVVLWPMTETADVFLRVGTGTTTIEVGGEDVDNNDVRYGAGVQFMFNDKDGVRVDLTRFNLDDDIDADVFTVSYTRKLH